MTNNNPHPHPQQRPWFYCWRAVSSIKCSPQGILNENPTLCQDLPTLQLLLVGTVLKLVPSFKDAQILKLCLTTRSRVTLTQGNSRRQRSPTTTTKLNTSALL